MIDWTTDLEAALARGRRERKAVLLYFGKDPCPECARLDAEVFSDRAVARAVGEGFVALKQLLGRDHASSRRYRPFWTPTLFFLDPDGHDLVRWPGLIAVDDMLALLDYGQAQVGIRRGRFKRSLALLEGIPEQWPESVVAPEALYWAGNLRYVMDGDRAALDERREELVRRYPETPAACRV